MLLQICFVAFILSGIFLVLCLFILCFDCLPVNSMRVRIFSLFTNIYQTPRMILDTLWVPNTYLWDEYINLMIESLLPILRYIILGSLPKHLLLRDLSLSSVRLQVEKNKEKQHSSLDILLHPIIFE